MKQGPLEPHLTDGIASRTAARNTFRGPVAAALPQPAPLAAPFPHTIAETPLTLAGSPTHGLARETRHKINMKLAVIVLLAASQTTSASLYGLVFGAPTPELEYGGCSSTACCFQKYEGQDFLLNGCVSFVTTKMLDVLQEQKTNATVSCDALCEKGGPAAHGGRYLGGGDVSDCVEVCVRKTLGDAYDAIDKHRQHMRQAYGYFANFAASWSKLGQRITYAIAGAFLCALLSGALWHLREQMPSGTQAQNLARTGLLWLSIFVAFVACIFGGVAIEKALAFVAGGGEL